MKALVRKISCFIFGTAFLLGALAPVKGFAISEAAIEKIKARNKFICSGQLPPGLEKYRDLDTDGKCANNEGVEINNRYSQKQAEKPGACEDAWATIKEAVSGISKEKKQESCNVVADFQQKMGSCLKQNAGNKDLCRNQLSDSLKKVKGASKELSGLMKQAITKLEQTENASKKAAEEIKAKAAQMKSKAADPVTHNKVDTATQALTKNSKPVSPVDLFDSKVSGVTPKDMIQEQEAAAKASKDAREALKKHLAETEENEKEFDKMDNVSQERTDNLKSIPEPDKDSKSGSPEQSANKPAEENKQEQKQAGGGAGGGMPSMPGGGQGGEGGNQNPGTPPTSTAENQDISTPATIAKAGDGNGKSKTNDLELNATPKKAEAGIEGPLAEGATNVSGASRSDTSLRDSLKKKLLGSQAEPGSGEALGGLPFGGGAGAKAKSAAAAANAPLSFSDDSSSGGSGGGGSDYGDSGGGGDFSMARSETDVAVHNLLNEFGAHGPVEDGRNLADIDSGNAGVEGENGRTLFSRVRGAMTRRLRNGSVVNGVNGKI